MHVRCVGSGAATVVLIAGFGDGGNNWGPIEGPITQGGARVCSYARFGTGTSDAPPDVQTFRSQATDLHTALDALGETGPYVVVGHSFGGAEAVAFASMFPSEVRGLMLLDASPTTWPAAACAVPDDGSDTAHNMQQLCAASHNPDSNPERLDIAAAFADVATITSLSALPTVVVTAAARTLPGLDPVATARLDEVWSEGQQHWASLSTVGRVVSVADTSHYIQIDQPAVVIDQIQQLLATSTTPASAVTAAAPSTRPTTN
jgi:pimeloyl-ACP methyl ester carboxylesterase